MDAKLQMGRILASKKIKESMDSNKRNMQHK
jgi:hypothetical protein